MVNLDLLTLCLEKKILKQKKCASIATTEPQPPRYPRSHRHRSSPSGHGGRPVFSGRHCVEKNVLNDFEPHESMIINAHTVLLKN